MRRRGWDAIRHLQASTALFLGIILSNLDLAAVRIHKHVRLICFLKHTPASTIHLFQNTTHINVKTRAQFSSSRYNDEETGEKQHGSVRLQRSDVSLLAGTLYEHQGSSWAEAQCLFVSTLATHEAAERKWKHPTLPPQMSSTLRRRLSGHYHSSGDNRRARWIGVSHQQTIRSVLLPPDLRFGDLHDCCFPWTQTYWQTQAVVIHGHLQRLISVSPPFYKSALLSTLKLQFKCHILKGCSTTLFHFVLAAFSHGISFKIQFVSTCPESFIYSSQ